MTTWTRTRVASRQAISDIDQEIANLRAIIADLRPSALDDLGLGPALQALIERRRRDGIEIECELDLPIWLDTVTPENQALETVVYRVIQETLTNVIKHARATRITVSVTADERAVLVEVTDDGRGFDVDASTAGFGLAGMRERVFLLGGSLAVESTGDGSRVRARLPLPDVSVVMPAAHA